MVLVSLAIMMPLGAIGSAQEPVPDVPVFVYATTPIAPQQFETEHWENIELGDDEVTEFAIPATSFFGAETTRLHVSSNGFVALGDYLGGSGCCSGGDIPAEDDVDGIIAGLWTDLDPRQCESRIAIDISDDWVTVAYENVTYYGSTCETRPALLPNPLPFTPPIIGSLFEDQEPGPADTAEFAVRISPSTGVIEVHLISADGANNATSGIESPDGTAGNETRHTSDPLGDPVAWRFTPLGFIGEPDPEPTPFVVRTEWNGFLACGVGSAGAGWAACSTLQDPNDEFMFTWEALPSIRDLVVGVRWEAGGDLDDELDVNLEQAPFWNEIAEAQGTSPLIAHVGDPEWGSFGNESFRLRVFAGGVVGVVYQLPFEAVIEEYHFQTAPEGRNPFEPLP